MGLVGPTFFIPVRLYHVKIRIKMLHEKASATVEIVTMVRLGRAVRPKRVL